MKVPKFNFYSSVITALLMVMMAAAIALFSACTLTPAIAPLDWHYDEPAEPIIIDTIEIDTCVFPEIVQEPLFVFAYHEITDLVQTDRTIIIGDHSAVVGPSNIDMIGPIVDSLWELYRPEYEYETYVSTDDLRMITLIKGTNDRQQFYLKAQIRYNGWKHFYGFDTKTIFPFGAITYQEYSDLIEQYPSVYRFNFYKSNYTQEQNVDLSLKALGVCKKGDWADFRFNNIPIPDSIPPKFEAAHWNTVLNNLNPGDIVYSRGKVVGKVRNEYVIDMRGYRVYDHDIATYLDKGYQVIADLD